MGAPIHGFAPRNSPKSLFVDVNPTGKTAGIVDWGELSVLANVEQKVDEKREVKGYPPQQRKNMFAVFQ